MSSGQKSGDTIEKRQVKRRHLVFYLRVFDGRSGRVLGHVVDISAEGIMLLSDVPIETNEIHRLRMRMPSEMTDSNEILFTATSRWCKRDENPDFYITGFQMHDLTEEHKSQIATLIEGYSFNDD